MIFRSFSTLLRSTTRNDWCGMLRRGLQYAEMPRIFTNKNHQRQILKLSDKNSGEQSENWCQKASKIRNSTKRLTTGLVENLKFERNKKRRIELSSLIEENTNVEHFSDDFNHCWNNLCAINAHCLTSADSVTCIDSKIRSIEFKPPFLESVEFLLWCGLRATRRNYRLSFNAMWSRLLSGTLRRLFSRTELVFQSEPQPTTVARRTENGGITVTENVEKIPEVPSKDRDDGIKCDLDEQQTVGMVGRGKMLPNYFVALQIKNEEIIRNIHAVQKKLVERQPLIKSALIPVENLHITLMVMHLDEEHCLHDAKKAMQLLVDETRRTGIPDSLSLTFDRIGNFKNGEVVFAEVVKNDEFRHVEKLAELTRDCFAKCGIASTDRQRPFTPHLTIAKMRNSRLSKNGIKKIRAEWYGECLPSNNNVATFGTETINSVQLLSMLKPKNPKTGYYHCAKEVTFG